MQPLRIRIHRIVDFGTVVSLVGTDTDKAMAVTVHVDHRPFASFRQSWREAGLPPPIEYAANELLLHLDMLPAGDADTVRLVEQDGAPTPIPSNDRPALEGMDR